jgi:hypothetical protein
MRWYLFFSRVALVTNIFFILFLFMKWYQQQVHFAVLEIIISMSVLSVVINSAVNLLSAGLLLFRKEKLKPAPVWMVTVNFIVLIMQVYHLTHLHTGS